MARYLLDTTALIDFSKGREPARSRILRMIDDGDDVGVCAINVAEFCAGLPPEQRPIWDEFIEALHYWDINLEAARYAGQLRYDLARKGQTLSMADALIAAVALAEEAVLITDNVRHYQVPGLVLMPLQG